MWRRGVEAEPIEVACEQAGTCGGVDVEVDRVADVHAFVSANVRHSVEGKRKDARIGFRDSNDLGIDDHFEVLREPEHLEFALDGAVAVRDTSQPDAPRSQRCQGVVRVVDRLVPRDTVASKLGAERSDRVGVRVVRRPGVTHPTIRD